MYPSCILVRDLMFGERSFRIFLIIYLVVPIIVCIFAVSIKINNKLKLQTMKTQKELTDFLVDRLCDRNLLTVNNKEISNLYNSLNERGLGEKFIKFINLSKDQLIKINKMLSYSTFINRLDNNDLYSCCYFYCNINDFGYENSIEPHFGLVSNSMELNAFLDFLESGIIPDWAIYMDNNTIIDDIILNEELIDYDNNQAELIFNVYNKLADKYEKEIKLINDSTIIPICVKKNHIYSLIEREFRQEIDNQGIKYEYKY